MAVRVPSGALPGRAPLNIPAGFQAEQAAGRLQELEKSYPRFQREFPLSELPEAIDERSVVKDR